MINTFLLTTMFVRCSLLIRLCLNSAGMGGAILGVYKPGFKGRGMWIQFMISGKFAAKSERCLTLIEG